MEEKEREWTLPLPPSPPGYLLVSMGFNQIDEKCESIFAKIIEVGICICKFRSFLPGIVVNFDPCSECLVLERGKKGRRGGRGGVREGGRSQS